MISFAEHRARFLELLTKERAAAVVATSPHRIRNHDAEYRFRPDSDFWWLTGFAEPESVLVLLPALTANAAPRCVLFLREKDRERETWTGRRLGVTAAVARLGIDEARPIEKLWTDLPELLKGYERIVHRTGVDEARDREMLAVLSKLRATAKAASPPPVALLDPAPMLHELRLFKDASELDTMRRAARITRDAHVAAMRTAKPGVNEREIDALLDATFRRLGGTGAAYTNIVAGGANATILHYVENDQSLRDGDLVLVDAGSEVDWYASDVTRTFPVNGRFTAEQRAVYQVVLDAQLAAIEPCAPEPRSTRRTNARSRCSAPDSSISGSRTERGPKCSPPRASNASTCTARAIGSVSTCTIAAPISPAASRARSNPAWCSRSNPASTSPRTTRRSTRAGAASACASRTTCS